MKRFLLKNIRYLFVLCLVFGLSCLQRMWAQKILPDVTSTEGREFFVAWLPNVASKIDDPDLKLQLIVNSRVDNNIRVEYAGGTTKNYAIPANQSVVIDDLDKQLIYWDIDKGEDEMVLNKGIRVYSLDDELFTLYSINQNGDLGALSMDAAHILPKEALGTEYIVQTSDDDAIATEFVVMSTKAGVTNVTVNTPVNTRKGGLTSTITFTGPKQIYIIRSKSHDPTTPNDNISLSGSTICADQTIAVWSGNQHAIIPLKDEDSHDHAYDQLLPINKWGKEFVVPLTGLHTQRNEVHVIGMVDGTTVTVTNSKGTTSFSLDQGIDSLIVARVGLGKELINSTMRIQATQPVQVYLYTSAAGSNPYDDDEDVRHKQGDPSMTMIPPLEYVTDTTIFRTFNGGVGNLTHQAIIWAKTSGVGGIKMDDNSISGQFSPIGTFAPGYSIARLNLTDGVHTLTAPSKVFSGYVYGMDDGQAYLFPVGYDFTPHPDSLFLADDVMGYDVRLSEWKEDYLSSNPKKGGWYLDKYLLDNGKYQLDSVYVCDSTELTFPIKTHRAWEKVRWEIEGTIQGSSYFTPIEQMSTDVPRPELTHQFTLLPIEQNDEPFEDFEVRGIIFHKPIICDIPEDKWDRDTFNTIVRVLRQYDDTTWRAICIGDTIKFFYDSLYNQNKLNQYDPTKKDSTTFIATTSGGVTKKWQVDAGLGDHAYQRHYLTRFGCDSLSTLMLFVCEPHKKTVDTVVCEKDLPKLKFGDFFKRFTDKGKSWPTKDTVLYDTLRATACMNTPEFEPFRKHCPDFNGCDSVMELHLVVKTVIDNSYRINQCLSKGTKVVWKEDKSERIIAEFEVDKNGIERDVKYTFRDTVKYTNCVGCPTGGCDSVRNTLELMFVSDAGQTHDNIHVCQEDSYTYTNLNASYTFNPNGKPCFSYGPNGERTPIPYPYDLPVEVTDDNGTVMCEFIDHLTFYIDTVYKDQMTYDTVCWNPASTNQRYSWKGHPNYQNILITEPSGEYQVITRRDKMQSQTGCDSLCVLKLTVARPFKHEDVIPMCDNKAITWQDTLFYGPNYSGPVPEKSRKIIADYDSRLDTFSRFGCDSVYTLHITINPTYVTHVDTSICESQTYDFLGKQYHFTYDPATDNTYDLKPDKDVISKCGCDSAVTHTVHVYPVYNYTEQADTLCQWLQEGDEKIYTWDKHPMPGEPDRQIYMLDLRNNKGRYVWTNKIPLDTLAGTYQLIDSLVTKACKACNKEHGCDSVHTKLLTIIPTYNITHPVTLSDKATLEWDGTLFVGPKAAIPPGKEGLEIIKPAPGQAECTKTKYYKTTLDTLRHSVGTHNDCDSMMTYVVTFGETYFYDEYDAVCENCSYTWSTHKDAACDEHPIVRNGTTVQFDYSGSQIPKAGETKEFTDSYTTKLGFDSTFVLHLTGYPAKLDYVATGETCQGETYDWIGHPGQRSVLYLVNADGSTTAIDKNYTFEQDRIYTIIDSMVTTASFFDPGCNTTRTIHCDSIWTLTLSVRKTYNEHYHELTDQVSMSSNDTLVHFTQPQVLFVGYDFDFDAAGVDKAEMESRYERVVYIKHSEGDYHRDSVNNTSQFGCDSAHYVDIHICMMQFTEKHDSIADNDTTWSFGGDITPVGGVRQHTLPLVEGTRYHYYDDGTPVDYSVATGRTERQYMLIDTMRSVTGCDSIIHNYLHVFPSYRFEFDTSICSNIRWDWRNQTYVNRYRTGEYYDSVNYRIGTHEFDSVYVLGLVVEPSDYWEFDTMLCMNDTMHWHTKTVYYRPGGLKWVEVTYDNDPDSKCGTIYHMNLTFKPFYGAGLIDHDTICQFDPYEWISPDETKPHTERLFNEAGQRVASIPTDIYGDFIYYDSLKTKECGCDSIYTLYLHIKRAFKEIEYDTICSNDSLLWRFHNFKNMNVGDTVIQDYFLTYPDECDSVYEIRLHVFSNYMEELYDTVCADERYIWHSARDTVLEHLAPGTHFFYDSLQTMVGCDSIFHLYLTIKDTTREVNYDTICFNDTLRVLHHRYTKAGDYKDTTVNAEGCHHFIYTHLAEIPPTIPTVWAESPMCQSETAFDVYYTYTSHKPIRYSLYFDSIGLSMGFEDMVNVPIKSYTDPMHISVPIPYRDGDKRNYPKPDDYAIRLVLDNGICQYVERDCYDDSTLTMSYPKWITEQRFGDVIAILNENYNGGYKWDHYQWYYGDSLLVGETHEYLFIPRGLEVGDQYHVRLIREGEEQEFPTCPITIVPDPIKNDFAPTMGYLSVTPTFVVLGHPVVSILSRKDGTYRVSTAQGELVKEGTFRADVTEVTLPAVSGVYIFQLWSTDTPEEPYRNIKVLVGQ